MPQSTNLPVRLAMRVEGDWWVAYAAKLDSMDGALRLGSVRMAAVYDPTRKQMFMDLMQGFIGDGLAEILGVNPQWNEPQEAPESERAGRA